MCSARRPSLTRLLETRNAADTNVVLDSELSLSQNILQASNNVLNKFIEFLKMKLKESNDKFKEIIVGGSLATRTEVNSEEDLDVTCHVMLDYGADSLTEIIGKFKESLPSVIQFVKECLAEYGDQVEVDQVLSGRIDCTLKVEESPVDIEVEIEPSFYWDNNDEVKREALYEQMITNTPDRRFYATSLCTLQINYVKDINNNRLRNLIRLAKFWGHRALPVGKENVTLPSGYLFEALAISLWERAGRPETFRPSLGFKAMMEEIEHYHNMNITPTTYFTKDKVHRALFNPRLPVLVDPCNPTRNLASECDCWNDVAKVAIATLGKPMLKDLTSNPRWQ